MFFLGLNRVAFFTSVVGAILGGAAEGAVAFGATGDTEGLASASRGVTGFFFNGGAATGALTSGLGIGWWWRRRWR